jgi:hypothetical protein
MSSSLKVRRDSSTTNELSALCAKSTSCARQPLAELYDAVFEWA